MPFFVEYVEGGLLRFQNINGRAQTVTKDQTNDILDF